MSRFFYIYWEVRYAFFAGFRILTNTAMRYMKVLRDIK